MSICAETPSGANGAAAPPLPSVTGVSHHVASLGKDRV